MSSPESFTPEGAENFVVDAEKAEQMARASNEFRSQAAEHRQSEKDLKRVGGMGSQLEARNARILDKAAEEAEKFAKYEFEIVNEISSIPASEFPGRLQATEKQLEALNGRLERLKKTPIDSSSENDSLLMEIRDQKNRLELYKREYEKGIESTTT